MKVLECMISSFGRGGSYRVDVIIFPIALGCWQFDSPVAAMLLLVAQGRAATARPRRAIHPILVEMMNIATSIKDYLLYIS